MILTENNMENENEYPLFPELTEEGKKQAQDLMIKFEQKLKEKAKDLIIQFMPHCGQHEFGQYVGAVMLHKNARDCAKRCVLEIMKAAPTMPRTIPNNDDELSDDVKNSKYFQIAQSKDYWNDVLKAIDTAAL